VTALDDAPVLAAPGRTAEVVLAEKAVLASMIASRAVAEEALDLLGPDDCMGEPEHWRGTSSPPPRSGSRSPSWSSTTRRGPRSPTSGRGCAARPAPSPPSSRSSTTCS
jgi:hypothetical protein